MTTQVTAEESNAVEDALIQCRHCRHFRQEPWETGYCRHTHMYVLETFSCNKFTRKMPNPES